MAVFLSRFWRLASRCRMGSGFRRGLSSLPFAGRVLETKELGNGVILEMLNETHNVAQLRQLLAGAFASTNEPLVESLCQFHYPTVSSAVDKLRLVEKKCEGLFSERSLTEKIMEGLSLVAVKGGNPKSYISVMFAETFRGSIYSSSDDDFCQDTFDVLRSVHRKAAPFVAAFPRENVAFLSHTATCAEYRSTGVVEAMAEFMFSRLRRKGFEVAYTMTTAERLARFAKKRFHFHEIAEVKYRDYEDINRRKLFENVPVYARSVKALVKFL